MLLSFSSHHGERGVHGEKNLVLKKYFGVSSMLSVISMV